MNWGSKTSPVITKTLPTNLGRSSLIADGFSPAGISEHRRSRRTTSKLSFSIIASARWPLWAMSPSHSSPASRSRSLRIEGLSSTMRTLRGWSLWLKASSIRPDKSRRDYLVKTLWRASATHLTPGALRVDAPDETKLTCPIRCVIKPEVTIILVGIQRRVDRLAMAGYKPDTIRKGIVCKLL